MQRRAALLFIALLAAPVAAASEPVPVFHPEASKYTDQDVAARAGIIAPPGRNAALRHMLDLRIKQSPKDVSALTQRAYLSQKMGDTQSARADLEAAAAAAAPGSIDEGHIFWSRGWIEYDAGDYAAAASDWQREVQSHGGRPFWAPYTFALLYWTSGDAATSLEWYDVAVRSNAALGDEKGLEDHISFWRLPQKQAMRAAFAAWRQQHANDTAR